ncbi:hypothetical protein A2567_00910 [Candidatus Azambacteria bacterium RIFOXYD1_FULL_42_11]|uniref:Uncharacterized protein n=1 Tax=Candidatus Azambacteria bacterium RIFOXYD1_FULL_42_11 TaxID=1797310 RepID=A0A1F5CG16_9BACT|nr:MAG: hypothetical protein A2567_00910 [Candidatus Azambacteria bacterium RIFOXYD1_FULL_42_11]
MKTLIILGIILGILSLYFVVNTEKSISIKGNEVVPGGIDIPKIVLENILPKFINQDNGLLNNVNIKNLAENIKDNISIGDLTAKALNKITDSIKTPIENKINEVLCPVK